MKKKYLLYAFLPIMTFSLLAAGTTYAVTTKKAKSGPFNTIASTIAKKFNLTTTDVQNVINEAMATERAQMKKNRPERVDPVVQAVKDGKLNQTQADLITAKKTEIKIATEKLKDATQSERMIAMKIQVDSLKQWATDNSIPEQYIIPFGGPSIGRSGERILGRQGFNKGKMPVPKTQTPTI